MKKKPPPKKSPPKKGVAAKTSAKKKAQVAKPAPKGAGLFGGGPQMPMRGMPPQSMPMMADRDRDMM